MSKEKEELQKQATPQFEVLQARVSEKLNSTTKHESFGYGTKVELAKRELGSYVVNSFFKEDTKKSEGSITTTFTVDIEALENYVKWHKEIHSESN